MSSSVSRLKHQDYTIAWICALPLESAAAEAMLDERHPPLPTSPNDENTYVLGRICAHNVIILCLPSGVYGTTAATNLASQMKFTFTAIRFGLMVGIGGGVPSKEIDIRLGDIVVSKPTREFGGVIQYDYGKTVQHGQFERSGMLNKPPPVILTAISRLQAAHRLESSKIPAFISEAVSRNPHFAPISTYPGEIFDILFESEYDHIESGITCDDCELNRVVKRITRDDHDPVIHYGLIASGNQVIKHGQTRDRLARELGILCFEMEAAGLMDVIPCLVIRGICDYADSHKNKRWQDYAAAIAAAYAKELLSVIHENRVADEPKAGSSSQLYHCQDLSVSEQMRSGGLTVRDKGDGHIDDWLIERISKYDHNRVHRRLLHKRLLGTTEWFLAHPDFKEWLTGNTIPTLWCSGKIGSGKTIIATSVVEELIYRSSKLRAPSIFFYCETEHPRSLQPSYILSSFIKQLCRFLHDAYVPFPRDLIREIHMFFGREPHTPDFQDLEDLFGDLYRYAPNTAYVIDGIDALDQGNCSNLLKFILRHFSCSSDRQGSKCILLSREQVPGFMDISTFIPGIRHISTSSHVMRDIQMYIETTIADKTLSRKLTTNSSLLHEIKETLLQESSGMFLWVYLQLEILWDTCFTDAQIRLSLGQLPKDLEETYRRCAQRIVMLDNIAVKVLKWVSFATRPLHIEELREAVAFTPLDTEWDAEKIPQQEIVAGCCANLVVVDPIDGCVRFAHSSVKQYLESNHGSHIEGYPVNADQGDLECGEYCLVYLSFSDFSLQVTRAEEVTVAFPNPAALIKGVFRSSLMAPFRRIPRGQEGFVPVRVPNTRAKRTSDRTSYKFLNYAASGWALHMKNIDTASPSWERFEHVATNFSDSWNFHPWVSGGRSAQSRLHALFGWAVKEHHEPLLSIALRSKKDLLAICDLPLVDEGFPALHLASKLGHYAIVQHLLRFCKVNVLDVEGYAPLHYAVAKRRLDVVQLILRANGCKVGIKSRTGDTPLFLAAINGDEDIALALLMDGTRTKNGNAFKYYVSLFSPLAAACKYGHPTIVQMLLEHGALLGQDYSFGRTPLSLATTAGHTDIVELLLKWGSPPDGNNRDGSTPLTEAARIGDEKLVQMLLERTKNLDCEDHDGRTPFFWASKEGHVEVMKLLLAKGADYGRADQFGDTPLFHAVRRNDVEMVRVLLEMGADLKTRAHGTNLLDFARQVGETEIIELLLKHGATDSTEAQLGEET
ncbi:hypothetical protein, variant 3 [Blastomyces dermatitidis ER-3]|uniref:Nucleoside phosphorylase domain-containing protein n=1 Tax=Ajellomyces dermatitidis (strain ER-3 / ATCC MYA-2586) TaxID=559297 RepID=A0ABX2VUN5_AJEDR|nr:uncharacterized protein BDCG_16773 [Blastomyces dermatitidis ER-3]XP_045280600.1 hypothetical protein, variant 1 [Blastomyces dermatitidis ER-3]XP_045280601.1 hypothetical protein, variant 2 [Blastomyces dermatitidis ER-3]XP_045280602.1 hypothetical protein, variant 3 [Blastomyces dermatitidis ER-3]OAT00872.1 hypothetical protein BDCG_16773 [Blastomyces dermatitidis ER-3]OAT00873.1 hypothetical protein, variant 1 [Blastomyces dermatitidis ER-3]OAT00874.1 hypothetical protein, variant 2 [Bl